MMRNLVRALVALVGLFNLAIGLGFLLDPSLLGAKFFLSPVGIQGLATIRADFPALFLTGGLFALYGAWRGRAAPLLFPLVMLAIALTGRFISLAVDGISPTAFPPMAVEAGMITVLLIGRRALSGQR